MKKNNHKAAAQALALALAATLVASSLYGCGITEQLISNLLSPGSNEQHLNATTHVEIPEFKGTPRPIKELGDEYFAYVLADDYSIYNQLLAHPNDYADNLPASFDASKNKKWFGDISLEAAEADFDYAVDLLSELYALDADALNNADRRLYDCLANQLENTLALEDYYYHRNPYEPSIGLQANLPLSLMMYSFRTQQDIEDYLELITDVPRIMGQADDIVRERTELGYIPNTSAIKTAIEEMESYTKEAAHNVIVASFETSLASNAKPFSELTQQQRDDYAAKHRTIVEKQVIPAYLTTIALLEELYAKANDTASLADLPNSKAYYTARMNYYGFSGTPEDAIKILDKRLDEYWDVLLSPPVGMTEPAQWSARALRVLGEDATDIVSFYNKKAKEDFPDIGMRPFVVDAASDDETIDKIMAFYMFAPVDDLDDNRIIFYPRNISDHFTLGSTLAHEAFPGHLYQYNYFGMKNPHPVELVFGSTAYDEGYAVYVQEYGSKYMGFNEKEVAYLTAYELYMRGLQARIDLGVNYEGWSVKETGKFLRAWGMEAFAKEIYEEIAAVPLLSLPYGLAPITFFDAREAAQKALGSAFDLKDFHAMLLDDGSVPLWTLDEKITAYIGGDAGAGTGSGASTGQTEKKAA